MRLQPHQLRALREHEAAGGKPEDFVMPPRIVRKRDNRESRLQKACVAWWRGVSASLGYDARLLVSTPNGALFGRGNEAVIRARILKDEGLGVGFPDLVLLVAISFQKRPDGSPWPATQTAWHHALFIELKLPETKPSPDQESYHTLLRSQGYRVEVVRTLEGFVGTVEGYLNIASQTAATNHPNLKT